MTWATSQTCGSAGAKLVLLMLANHSNGHTGQCNPRHKRLAIECDMTVETLKTHLKKLQSLGLIDIVHQYAEGVQLPNQYMLNFQVGGVNNYPYGGVEISVEGGGKNPPTYKQELNQEVNIEKKTVSPPNGVSITVWQDFQKLRRTFKAPITETAMAGIQREADKAGYSLEKALTTCVERSWRGFKSEWITDKPEVSNVMRGVL